jgi:hypothetical protein
MYLKSDFSLKVKKETQIFTARVFNKNQPNLSHPSK